MSRFVHMKGLSIGNECFMNVDELKLIGFSLLESVVIGSESFTKKKNGWGKDPNRHFYLMNCPKVKTLKIGSRSFSDYTVCEIENVNALETIEIGDLTTKWSENFAYASLELRSVTMENE